MFSVVFSRKEKINIIFILMVLFILFSGCAAKEKQDTSDSSGDHDLGRTASGRSAGKRYTCHCDESSEYTALKQFDVQRICDQ